MAEPSFVVGILGNLISILVFASPIATFWRVVKNKSTENFKWLPYVTTLLTTSLWTFYGFIKPDGILVITVNVIGTFFEAVYVILYLIYAPKETRMKIATTVLIVNVGVVAAAVVLAVFTMHGVVRLHVVGSVCAALTIGMYASPMAAMRTVMKTRSVEYMPFSLSFFLALNAGIWIVYSVLVSDYFIGVPNAIGFTLGLVQLVLYFIYRRKAPARTARDIADEAGDAAGWVNLGVAAQMEMIQLKRQLHKGRSLPMSSPTKQHSSPSIVKSTSATPYELGFMLPLMKQAEIRDAETMVNRSQML